MRRPDLTGTYTWHFVSDINKIEGIEEGIPYLVCFEEPDAEKASWHMVIARWFLEDTEISLTDKEGSPHIFKVDSRGFYIISEFGKATVYRLKDVKYWTKIELPKVNPDDILTIG